MNPNKKMKKEKRQQERYEALNAKYIERYGVTYQEVKDRLNANKKKGKGFWGLKTVFQYAKKEKARFIMAIIIASLLGVFNLILPIGLQNVIDNLTISNWELVLIWGGVYALAQATTRAGYWIFNILSAKATQKTAHYLREELANAVLNTKASRYDTVNTGEILNRINNDTVQVTDSFSQIISTFCDVIEEIVFTMYAFYINVWLGLVLFVCGMVGFVTSFIYNKEFQKRNHRRSKIIGDKNAGAFNEMVRGNCDVKNLNLKNAMLSKLSRLSHYRYISGIDATVQKQLYMRTGAIVQNLFLFVFFVVAIFMLQNALVTLGGVIVLLNYRWNIFLLFEDTNVIYDYIQTSEVCAERIGELLDETKYPKEKFGTEKLENPKGEITFENVYFRYRDDTPLFEDLNFKIKAGETVGIVGKSGQGKSTIINLIPRIYEINGGRILLDSVDVSTLDEDSLRSAVSVVPQSPYIFNMTIKENLLFAKPNATDEEINEVCKKAQIYDFIMSKPEGMDSIVGESGLMLSGGQKQRLAIARALLKESKVLLLDEATSALDNESQSKIKDVIQNLGAERTVIIVAHRLTTVVDCDRIFVLDKNKLIAQGTHAELKKNCEVYKNLYKSEE